MAWHFHGQAFVCRFLLWGSRRSVRRNVPPAVASHATIVSPPFGLVWNSCRGTSSRFVCFFEGAVVGSSHDIVTARRQTAMFTGSYNRVGAQCLRLSEHVQQKVPGKFTCLFRFVGSRAPFQSLELWRAFFAHAASRNNITLPLSKELSLIQPFAIMTRRIDSNP